MRWPLVRLRISTNALKTLDRRGGLDGFLMKPKDDERSIHARDIRRQVQKKLKAAS
jgi:large subunit ribosomal protein L28